MKTKEIKISEIVVPEEVLRDYADPEKLEELKESLSRYGLLHPIVVRKTEEGYKIIAGLRRTIAARELGWETITAHVIEREDEREDDIISLEENIKREEISPVQEGKWFKYLMSKGMTMREIAEKIGKSQGYVQQRVELVEAEKDLQEAVERGEISFSVAREIMDIKDPGDREYIKHLAKTTGANVRQVQSWKKSLEQDKQLKSLTPDEIKMMEEEREERVPTFICPVCKQETELGLGISLVLCPVCYSAITEELKKGG